MKTLLNFSIAGVLALIFVYLCFHRSPMNFFRSPVAWNQDAGVYFGKYTCFDGQTVELTMHNGNYGDSGPWFVEGAPGEFANAAKAKSYVERELPSLCR